MLYLDSFLSEYIFIPSISPKRHIISKIMNNINSSHPPIKLLQYITNKVPIIGTMNNPPRKPKIEMIKEKFVIVMFFIFFNYLL